MSKTEDQVADIMRYESGEMGMDEVVAFFQRLIDDGIVWQLQGSYGRTAHNLITSGLCHTAKRKSEAEKKYLDSDSIWS